MLEEIQDKQDVDINTKEMVCSRLEVVEERLSQLVEVGPALFTLHRHSSLHPQLSIKQAEGAEKNLTKQRILNVKRLLDEDWVPTDGSRCEKLSDTPVITTQVRCRDSELLLFLTCT